MINESFDYKMVIVTRKDLNLSKGKLSVQVAHAAVVCALETKKHHKKWFTKWMREGSKKAVVKTESVNDFIELKRKADELDLATVIISDAGHTEIPTGTKTVLGVGPGPYNLVDQVTGNLSLL
jgi:peptidyl-tRNA hydrolase, PTH2 family